MDLREILENIPSSKEREIYISEFSKSQLRFDELINFAFRQTDPLAWRAAWVLDGCDEKDPALSENYISKIINKLPDLESDGTRRSFLRLLSRHEIPEDDQGLLADLCFQYLVSEIHPVAVKVHAMQILFNLTKIYPELGPELIGVIEDQFINNSVGFRSRGQRIINQLQKIVINNA